MLSSEFQRKQGFRSFRNINLRRLIDNHLEQYTQALTRAEKSMVIIQVVRLIQERSPEGGFARFCKTMNCYVEIGDREKVGLSSATRSPLIVKPPKALVTLRVLLESPPLGVHLKCKEAVRKPSSTSKRRSKTATVIPNHCRTHPYPKEFLCWRSLQLNFIPVERKHRRSTSC